MDEQLNVFSKRNEIFKQLIKEFRSTKAIEQVSNKFTIMPFSILHETYEEEIREIKHEYCLDPTPFLESDENNIMTENEEEKLKKEKLCKFIKEFCQLDQTIVAKIQSERILLQQSIDGLKEFILIFENESKELPFVKGTAPQAIRIKNFQDFEIEIEYRKCTNLYIEGISLQTRIPVETIKEILYSLPDYPSVSDEILNYLQQLQKVHFRYLELTEQTKQLISDYTDLNNEFKFDHYTNKLLNYIYTKISKIIQKSNEINRIKEITFLLEIQLEKIYEDCSFRMEKIYISFLEKYQPRMETKKYSQENSPTKFQSNGVTRTASPLTKPSYQSLQTVFYSNEDNNNNNNNDIKRFSESNVHNNNNNNNNNFITPPTSPTMNKSNRNSTSPNSNHSSPNNSPSKKKNTTSKSLSSNQIFKHNIFVNNLSMNSSKIMRKNETKIQLSNNNTTNNNYKNNNNNNNNNNEEEKKEEKSFDPYLEFWLNQQGFIQHFPVFIAKNINLIRLSKMKDVDFAEMGEIPAMDCLALHNAVSLLQFGPKDSIVVNEGWMWKGREINKPWKKRYFRLTTANQLIYYTCDKSKNILGTIDLEKDAISITKFSMEEEKFRYCFKIESPLPCTNHRVFCCVNSSIRNSWMSLINSILTFSSLSCK